MPVGVCMVHACRSMHGTGLQEYVWYRPAGVCVVQACRSIYGTGLQVCMVQACRSMYVTGLQEYVWYRPAGVYMVQTCRSMYGTGLQEYVCNRPAGVCMYGAGLQEYHIATLGVEDGLTTRMGPSYAIVSTRMPCSEQPWRMQLYEFKMSCSVIIGFIGGSLSNKLFGPPRKHLIKY